MSFLPAIRVSHAQQIIIGTSFTALAIESAIPSLFRVQRMKNPLTIPVINTELFELLVGNIDDLVNIVVPVAIRTKGIR
jgi:hypothetical protein